MPINSRNESITEWNCNEKLANRKLEKTEKIRLDFSFFSASSPVFRQFEGHWNEFATSFYLSCNRITRERGRKKTDRCSSNFLSFFLSFFSLFPLFPQFTSQFAFFFVYVFQSTSSLFFSFSFSSSSSSSSSFPSDEIQREK